MVINLFLFILFFTTCPQLKFRISLTNGGVLWENLVAAVCVYSGFYFMCNINSCGREISIKCQPERADSAVTSLQVSPSETF